MFSERNGYVLFLVLSMIAFSLLIGNSCGDDDDDDAAGGDLSDCLICQSTTECTEAFGSQWGCLDGCCVDFSDQFDDGQDDDWNDDDWNDDDWNDDDWYDDDWYDDDWYDDDWYDDDFYDDDFYDDDFYDDDDDWGDSPHIYFAYWGPSIVTFDLIRNAWISNLEFTICDKNNDLAGGSIFVYVADSADLIWDEPYNWSDFPELPDVSDCTNPQTFMIPNIFHEGATPPGVDDYICHDMSVTDGDDNYSNLYQYFCVYVP